MRKFFALGALLLALAIPAVAYAATLDTSKFGDLIGQCSGGTATYHFVNNQLGNPGVPDGTLTYSFSGHPANQTTGPSMNNGPTQHFLVTSSGTLLSASTNLGGKLVLSDVTCKKGKK
jgi:hypothetical protein